MLVRPFFQTVATTFLLAFFYPAIAQEEEARVGSSSDLSEAIVGTWEGPLVMGNTMNFVYEFTQQEDGLAGRWKTKERQKWIKINDLQVTSDSVFFIFETRPEIMEVTLILDEPTGFLNGEAKFPSRETGIPMTVAKVSDNVSNEE